MVVDTIGIDRAGELKRELVEFSQQPRYSRALGEVLADQQGDSGMLDEHQLMMLWDYFVLEHPLRNGRTVLEQFVDARRDLSESERAMLLGWRDVVQGPFEVQKRDGPALIVVNLVDELTYRVKSNLGRSALRQMPRRSFLITRLVAVDDDWMLSGPTSVLRPADREVAYRLALDLALRIPEAVYRNPEKLAAAWKIQQADRERFVRFFGSDLVVLPGDQVSERMGEYFSFCHEEVSLTATPSVPLAGGAALPDLEFPPDLTEAETVALIYDEVDGLGFYAEFGLVESVFADPDLLRLPAYREQVLTYLRDDTVHPLVINRLADRDPHRASVTFRRLLHKPRFDWTRDGEGLLRKYKAAHFDRPARPRVSPVSARLAAYAGSG